MAFAFIALGIAPSLAVQAATVSPQPSNAYVQSRVSQIEANVIGFQPHVAVYKAESRYETDLKWVMKVNKISRAEAIVRKDRAHFSQSGLIGTSPVSPLERFVFNPATGAWQTTTLNSFYAGWNPLIGAHVTTEVKRAEVRADNYWYCPTGKQFVYTVAGSVCQ